MCTIILKRAEGAKIQDKQYQAAIRANGHGVGIMFFKGRKIHVEKIDNSKKSIADTIAQIKKLTEGVNEFAIHFRYATHGKVSLNNCHPFIFPDSKRCLMHNGILPKANILSDNGKITDTEGYINKVLCPELVKRKVIDWDNVAFNIGAYNKFVVAENKKFIIVNSESGIEFEGNWYSNSDAITKAQWRDYTRNSILTDKYAVNEFKWQIIDVLVDNGLMNPVRNPSDIDDANLLEIIANGLGHDNASDCLYADDVYFDEPGFDRVFNQNDSVVTMLDDDIFGQYYG